MKGMMRATMPKGSRTENENSPGPMGTECPFISVTNPAKKSSCDAAISTSMIKSRHGFPPVAASISASSLAFSRRRWAKARIDLARSRGRMDFQARKPACAAVIALSTSAVDPCADVTDLPPCRGITNNGVARVRWAMPRSPVIEIEVRRHRCVQAWYFLRNIG